MAIFFAARERANKGVITLVYHTSTYLALDPTRVLGTAAIMIAGWHFAAYPTSNVGSFSVLAAVVVLIIFRDFAGLSGMRRYGKPLHAPLAATFS